MEPLAVGVRQPLAPPSPETTSAVEEAVPFTSRAANGFVFPIPRYPFELIVSAVAVEVAKVAAEEVAKYRLPPTPRTLQRFPVAPSEKVSCGAVEEASVRSHCGVVVPIPNKPWEFSHERPVAEATPEIDVL